MKGINMRFTKIAGCIVMLGIWMAAMSSASAEDADSIIENQWVGYFDIPRKGPRSAKKVLVESMYPAIVDDYTKQEDFWYYIKYSDYKGPKQRLAVIEFANKTPDEVHAMVPLADLEAQLTTAFFETNRYVLLERKEVEKVIQEQDFGASGRVSQPSAAKIGSILGAQYLVQAAVVQYIPDAAKFGAGGGVIGNGAAGALGISRERSELTMNIRIIDATTGEKVASIQKTGWQAAYGVGLGGAGVSSSSVGGGAAGGSRKLNIGRAAESCMAKCVYEIVRSLKDKTWQGSVMLVKDGKVYVNAGSNLGMRAGMTLKALSKGEDLVDPDT